MSPGSHALERYRKLSEAMLDAAQAQEWEHFVRLGTEREAIAATFPTDLAIRLPASELAATREIIERCQALDAQIHVLAEARQKDLRVLLRVTP